MHQHPSHDAGRATGSGEPDHAVTILATPEVTDGRIALIELRGRHGAGPPLHRHSREDELIYVLDGRVTFHLAGERIDGGPEAWVFLSRGSEHGYAIESETARLLVVLVPAERGIEECIRALSHDAIDPAGTDPASAPDIERLVTTAARYGVEITGPRPDGPGSGARQ
jgi:quercetin dioxygenase-like cupin family protein